MNFSTPTSRSMHQVYRFGMVDLMDAEDSSRAGTSLVGSVNTGALSLRAKELR
jgi:hypothetical protein